MPHVNKQLWGGEFWTAGYFASTVGRHGNEKYDSDVCKRPRSGIYKIA